jgi:hypothetical protein
MTRKTFVSFCVLLSFLIFSTANLRALNECVEADKLFPIVKGLKFGYINNKGQVVVKPQFDFADSFYDGMGRVEKDGKFGFINSVAKIVVFPQYNMVSPFSDGLASVKIPDGTCTLCGEWAFINKDGQVVIRMGPITGKSPYIGDFSEGFASFMIEEKNGDIYTITPYGFIDKSGNIAIPAKFGIVGDFHEGLASFAKDFMRYSGYGFINTKGEIVIETCFSSVGQFKDGLACVKFQGKWGFIDNTGKFVIEPQFEDESLFSEGFAAVKLNDKYGYIDKAGRIVIKPQFKWAGSFSEGMAPAELNGKYGFINKEGKFVIPPQFEKVDEEGFSCGVAKIYATFKINYPYKIGYIDTQGKYIWKPTI